MVGYLEDLSTTLVAIKEDEVLRAKAVEFCRLPARERRRFLESALEGEEEWGDYRQVFASFAIDEVADFALHYLEEGA